MPPPAPGPRAPALPTVLLCLSRPGPDPCEHVPDCGDQPRPRQRASAGGHGPSNHQDIGQRSHHGRPGCGSGDVGTVTCSPIMASFSSLLQFFYMFAEVQSNGIKSLDLERKVLVTFFLKKEERQQILESHFFKAPLLGFGGARNHTDFTVPKKPNCGRTYCAETCVYLCVCMCECEYMYMCTYGHTHLHMCIKYMCTYIYMYETRMELTV